MSTEMALGRANLKTLYIMKILTERTDETHRLSASEIRDILMREYDIDIDRRTIYTEMEKLSAFGLDIELVGGKGAGYYLASRSFELPELKLLVDAVQFSRFITEKKSGELIRKLEGLCSREEARQLSGQVVIYNRPKTTNETIYYNVDMLHSAIFNSRQIAFVYADWTLKKKLEPRHDGAVYRVSPLHLIWDDENYYLIGFDENAKTVKHYRVDKMRNMEVRPVRRTKKAIEQKVDLAAFSRKTFGMFGGEDEEVYLLCENRLIGVILDRFGTDVGVKPEGEDHFSAHMPVTVSPQFFGWIAGLGRAVKITGPEPVRRKYLEFLKGILEEYGREEDAVPES